MLKIAKHFHDWLESNGIDSSKVQVSLTSDVVTNARIQRLWTKEANELMFTTNDARLPVNQMLVCGLTFKLVEKY